MNVIQLLLRYVTAPFRFLLKGPTYLIAAPRRILGLSPPARAAILLAVAMVFCTLTVVVVFWNVELPHSDLLRSPKWYGGLFLLSIATPLALYYLVRLWLEGDASQFPELDDAWDAGLAALQEQGLEPADMPLFLIVGAPNDTHFDALVAAGRLNTVVPGSPKGSGPLRWYASDEAIYLAFTGTGRLGKLSQLAAQSARYAAEGGSGSPGGVTATMVVGGGDSPSDSGAFSGAGIMGTLDALPPLESMAAESDSSRRRMATPSSRLSHPEKESQTEQLAYVCRRLQRVRRPYCAANGILATLPHAVLNDIAFARDVPESIRADLATISNVLQLNCSVTVIVTGMEVEAGFTELTRRVGIEKAANSRFGKGFNVWNEASDENMDALSSHTCGAFEDWVYKLFAGGDAESKRSNGQLYQMLCRVRRHLQPKLRDALVNGLASDAAGNTGTPRLMGGCYFAATGASPEQQAFVRSVFDKLNQLSEDLQWNNSALSEESRYRWVTWLLTALNGALLIAAGYLAYKCIELLVN